MPTSNTQTKQLKKYDDTKPKKTRTYMKKEKMISKPRTRGGCRAQLKLLPGQQILTFKPKIIKQNEQQVKFYCYDEKTMQWPQEFTKKIIHHNVDNDQESNEYIVEREVGKCVASLVEEIAFKKISELDETIGFDFLISK